MAGATVTGYRVLDTLKHGGRRLSAGDRLTHSDIRDDQAAPLVSLGVLVADEWPVESSPLAVTAAKAKAKAKASPEQE